MQFTVRFSARTFRHKKGTKKDFQSKANRPLVNICMGDITNKFEQVLGGGRGPKVNKFEQVLVVPMLEGGAWG